jgi:hypothetical protein
VAMHSLLTHALAAAAPPMQAYFLSRVIKS